MDRQWTRTGLIQIFPRSFGVLNAYTLRDLPEATYGFVLTISRRRSVPRYGRGIGESLRYQQDYRS